MKILRSAALLAAVCWALPARAQEPDTAAVTTALWTACPGATVRVAAGSGAPVAGRCGEVADGRLHVDVEGAVREIALVEVDSLWVRRSYRTEAMVAFTLLGVGVGMWYANTRKIDYCYAYGCNAERRGQTLVGGSVGAVAGAVLGLAGGSLVTRWRRQFP